MWKSKIQSPRRLKALEIRERIEAGIGLFFRQQGFRSVRTPILVASPGMETHIRPMKVEGSTTYLHTSPEFAMKKLLAGGLEKIFQLAPVFRVEPSSRTHDPEFLMLEWYRAYAGYEQIMSDTENLFASLGSSVQFRGKQIDLRPPWPRLSVRDLFRDQCDIDLAQADKSEMSRACHVLSIQTDGSDSWDDLFFKLWLNQVEKSLPADRAVFVLDYPASQAALANTYERDGAHWAKRFEVFAGGLELGNAFDELTDATEQRRRFEVDMQMRKKIYGADFPANPLDESFLTAVNELPPCTGIAMGVDRMVMLFADEPDIAFTRWLPPHFSK